MARVVDELPPLGGGEPKYPWDQWLDGQVWLLDPAVDFPPGVKTHGFRSAAANAARGRGLRVAIRVRPEGVYLQAVER